MPTRRVLILAETCNPEWPSLPIVGYKYARALAGHCDVTIATHVRNRENFEKAGELLDRTHFIDTEYIAAPMHRVSTFLRGGRQVAWSTGMMMSYLPYLAFERQVRKRFRAELESGGFDIVHRITPMSPTIPSPLARRTGPPFVLGPLNGNLDWPAAFAVEQKREREGLRRLRGLYKALPYARATVRNSACILAAFSHTIADLDPAAADRIVPFPEIGFDPDLFHAGRDAAPFSGGGPFRFLYAGRLVPYKVPEAAVRAFATSEALAGHVLHVVGDGPERPRLEAIVAEHGAGERIRFEGVRSQAEVADFMRRCDAFVFPSIRELGAGVVIEAMASGMLCIVTGYGAPGDLVGTDRGLRVPLQPMAGLVDGFRAAMEQCLRAPGQAAALAAAGRDHAHGLYTWDRKARYTRDIYEALLSGRPLAGFTEYGRAAQPAVRAEIAGS